MTLSLGTAYRSFGGEMEASSTPMICRLLDSCRHQLSAIAPPHQDRTTDGDAQGAADGNGRPALLPVEVGGGHQLCAQSLGWADAVPQRRAGRGRLQYGGAFDAPDRNGPPELIVQRQRGWRRELGDPGIAR